MREEATPGNADCGDSANGGWGVGQFREEAGGAFPIYFMVNLNRFFCWICTSKSMGIWLWASPPPKQCLSFRVGTLMYVPKGLEII